LPDFWPGRLGHPLTGSSRLMCGREQLVQTFGRGELKLTFNHGRFKLIFDQVQLG